MSTTTPETSIIKDELDTYARVAQAFASDPGNAQKIEATHESFMEHVQKGGPVMIPIFAMAGIALLIALFKWFSFLLIGKPSKKNLRKLQEVHKTEVNEDS